ncbi:MAG TPA: sulfatase, partial [Thermoanaerobaculia bacterium]|nr:sulfatase [Thermoanaerobaculia bacterium]
VDEPPQEVTFLVNGREAGKVTLERGFHDYRLVIPAGALVAGDNRFVARYGFTRVPRELTSGMDPDARRLGVLWDTLRFETGVDPRAEVRATGRQLYIPYGVRVDYYTRFPARAALLFERLQARGDEGAALRVTVRTESEEEGSERVSPSPEAAAVRLPEVEQPVRVSLTAVPAERPKEGKEGAVPAASGVVLTRPALGAVRTAAAGRGTVAAAEAAAVARRPGQRLPNVIFYMVDTLRADHLGCYGYGKPVSPHVDAFAREATLFETAVAQSPWTRPSVASMFTGVGPKTHGVNGRKDTLSPEALTLAEMLRSRGYRTAGFATNGNVAKAFGVAQGFDTYELLPRARQHSRFVHQRAAEWLAEHGDDPFFLYLHTVDPHSPYKPEEPFRARFAPNVPADGIGSLPWLARLQTRKIPATPEVIGHLLALYDAEIAQNDASFGALMDLLRERRLWDDTVVVFVSDHGEEFHDHGGWEHGKTLYAEMVQVPLIIRFPGLGEGKRVASVAQHIDLVPTLLTYLGLPLPPHVEGRDLLPSVLADDEAGDGNTGRERAAFSYMEVDGHRGSSAVTDGWHFIDIQAPTAAEKLYQRREDPAQRQNRTGDSPVARGYLRTLLEVHEGQRRQTLRPGEGVLDEELREQLRALGYIQ